MLCFTLPGAAFDGDLVCGLVFVISLTLSCSFSDYVRDCFRDYFRDCFRENYHADSIIIAIP